MQPSEPTKAHNHKGSLLYLNQLSGRLPVATAKILAYEYKGNEIFSTAAQFLKEIGEVGLKREKCGCLKKIASWQRPVFCR